MVGSTCFSDVLGGDIAKSRMVWERSFLLIAMNVFFRLNFWRVPLIYCLALGDRVKKSLLLFQQKQTLFDVIPRLVVLNVFLNRWHNSPEAVTSPCFNQYKHWYYNVGI